MEARGVPNFMYGRYDTYRLYKKEMALSVDGIASNGGSNVTWRNDGLTSTANIWHIKGIYITPIYD